MFKRRRRTTHGNDPRRSLQFEGLDRRCMLASWAGADGCPVAADEMPENQDIGDRQTEATSLPVSNQEPCQPGTGGNVALGDVTPDIQSENLQPAPDYEAMTPAERSIVEIISQAIADEEYRAALFSDATAAIAGYLVTDDDQIALGLMPEESFDFFASMVEARLGEAMAGDPEGALSEAQTEVLQHVVHAVWRDLNPGGLAYVLAYKIPNKHLKR